MKMAPVINIQIITEMLKCLLLEDRLQVPSMSVYKHSSRWKFHSQIFVYRYGTFRLIDLPGLKKIMPVTMENFLEHVEKSTTKGVNTLRYDWLPECCAIIDMRRDDVEKWMPEDNEVHVLCNDHNSIDVFLFPPPPPPPAAT